MKPHVAPNYPRAEDFRNATTNTAPLHALVQPIDSSGLQTYNRKNSYNSNWKKNTIKVERYIFDRSLYYIQAGKRSLKISCAIIRNTANSRERCSSTTLRFICSQ